MYLDRHHLKKRSWAASYGWTFVCSYRSKQNQIEQTFEGHTIRH